MFFIYLFIDLSIYLVIDLAIYVYSYIFIDLFIHLFIHLFITKPFPDLRHLSGLDSLETGPMFGAYVFLSMEGDAPSMWHLLVRSVEGCQEE